MRNETVKKIVPLIIFVFGLLATLSIFAPALYYEPENLTLTGFEIAFGTTLADNGYFLDLDAAELQVNYIVMAAYFSPLIAGLLTLILRSGNLFSLAMFVMAAVLFFLLPDYVEVVHGADEIHENLDWEHAYGLIVAAFASVVAALGEMLHISMAEQE